MRCVIVTDHASHVGGESSVVFAQAMGLSAIGVKVSVFACFGPTSDFLNNHAEDVCCISPERGRRDRLAEIWNKRAERELGKYLSNFNPSETVVHVHSCSLGLSGSIGGALRNSKIPYFITANDAGWACPTGTFYNFQTKESCELDPYSLGCVVSHCERRTYAQKLFKLLKLGAVDYLSGLKKEASAFIVPSAVLKRKIRSRIPQEIPIHVVRYPVRVVNNGQKTVSNESFVFVGRLVEEKGCHELLSSVANKYDLVVIGDGPLRDQLQMEYPGVVFKGSLPYEDVLKELREARALILPSVWLEAFGLVVPEALSQGTPVIVSKRVGASELVHDGINGFVIDITKPGSLSNCCDLLLDENKAFEMSYNAYAGYWEDPLSVERYTNSLIQIYKNAFDKKVKQAN